MGTGKYLLDKEHFALYPDFEDNQVVMTENEPSSVQAQEKKEKARKEKAAKMPTQEEASEYFLKNKQEQLGYLIASSLRIEKGLATLTQNQESLERIVEQKFYAVSRVTPLPVDGIPHAVSPFIPHAALSLRSCGSSSSPS